MDNPSYVTLSRMQGLAKNLDIVANNLANATTTGFRREGVIFAEVVERLDVLGGSSSQAAARVRSTDFGQGALSATGGTFDFAIEGDGFFQIETEEGVALTRAGSFARNLAGELTTPDGRRVLGEGGAPVFFPPDARSIEVATDGTISADGEPVGRIAVVSVADLSTLSRRDGGLFVTEEPLNAAPDAAIFQGFVEQSNVNAIHEISRMIEVQRAYEMGQSFLTTEDERMRQAVRVMGSAL